MTQGIHIMVKCLHDSSLQDTDIISWSSPIPYFGNAVSSRIATLGLNPSNREFVDENGKELFGPKRRFQTLNSLGLECWSKIENQHLIQIEQDCENYFGRNPYDQWFKKLDNIISGTSLSYYFPSGQACHLDLIPFATSRKWGELSGEQKEILLNISAESFVSILNNSNLELLILNGKSVVTHLQKIANATFHEEHQPKWTLPRKNLDGVKGYAYMGEIVEVGGIRLHKMIKVIGYNHNIQSSFGVTTNVQKSIRDWVAKKSKEILDEKS
jgi:hypothetical protein